QRSDPVRWIDGESLLEPAAKAPPRFAGTRDLLDLPPGLLLVDFSTVRPERLLANDATYLDPAGTGSQLEELLAWAQARGHRVALGLPRYVLASVDLDPLRRSAGQLYYPLNLFSPRYEHHVQRAERLLRGPLPLPDLLRNLVSANSPSLPGAVA